MIDYSEKFLDILVPIFRPKLSKDPDYPLIQKYPLTGAPKRSYATINVVHVEDIGTLEEGIIDIHGQKVKQHQDVTIRVTTFGEKAYTSAAKLAKSLEWPSMTDILGAAGVGFRSSTRVRDTTKLIQSTYEERATFDMILGTADGNFVNCYAPSKDGQPSEPYYDEGIVPIEAVCVTLTGVENEQIVYTETVKATITTEI